MDGRLQLFACGQGHAPFGVIDLDEAEATFFQFIWGQVGKLAAILAQLSGVAKCIQAKRIGRALIDAALEDDGWLVSRVRNDSAAAVKLLALEGEVQGGSLGRKLALARARNRLPTQRSVQRHRGCTDVDGAARCTIHITFLVVLAGHERHRVVIGDTPAAVGESGRASVDAVVNLVRCRVVDVNDMVAIQEPCGLHHAAAVVHPAARDINARTRLHHHGGSRSDSDRAACDGQLARRALNDAKVAGGIG